MNINGYTLKAELNNANSGFSKWGFATKGRKEYFIKELINPVYPMDRSVMSPELFESRRAFCTDYEQKYKKMYEAINGAGYGNLVRIVEFFRQGSRYYIIAEKVDGKSVPMETIAAQPKESKYLLLKSVAYGIHCLHKAGIVHFDVKPNNILVKKTRKGKYTGKIIDFDSGFFKEDQKDVELGGDLTYLAPETFLAISGEDVKITEKADIFALGLVFHQYFTGQLPYFDTGEYEYPFEAALDEQSIMVDAELIPPEICDLIIKMIDVDPAARPSAEEILNKLTVLMGNAGSRVIISNPYKSAEAERTIYAPSTETPTNNPPSTSQGDWFRPAGDL